MHVTSTGFDDFYRLVWSRVMAYAERRVGHSAAADVASEALFTAWQKWDGAPRESEESLVYWVLAIARNKVLHKWRQGATQKRVFEELHLVEITNDRIVKSAEETALARMEICASFQSLAAKDQEVLIEECSPKAVGETDKGRGANRAMSMRQSRARARFRRSLDSAEAISPPA